MIDAGSPALDHFAALETPLDEAPLFFVQEPDADPASEHVRQCKVVKQCRRAGLKPMAIPNARAWGMKAWNLAKAEGVTWGACDLLIFGPGARIAIVEMKNGTAMPEQHQVDCLNALVRLGFDCAVMRTAGGVMAWLSSLGWAV